VRADLVEAGNLLAEAGGSGTFDLLGYSLGARIALHAALSRPERIGRLVLIGARRHRRCPGPAGPAPAGRRVGRGARALG